MGTERWRHNASLPHRELVINEARACQLPSRVLLQIRRERERKAKALLAQASCLDAVTARHPGQDFCYCLWALMLATRVAWNCLMNVKALWWAFEKLFISSFFRSFLQKNLQKTFNSRGCDDSVEITNDSACATRIMEINMICSQFILQETINPRKFHALMLPSE